MATATTLRVVDKPKVPMIPKRGTGLKWTPEALAWWKRTWSSPMSSEYDGSDFSGIVRRVYLEDAYWVAVHDGAMGVALKVAAEIRIQDAEYGLTPMARRRLQWTIDQGEAAEERTTARRKTRKSESGPKAVPAAVDPRAMLA